ncbi:hypothetical protein ACFPRL_08155 [Pseudoclavibacter helvolus]
MQEQDLRSPRFRRRGDLRRAAHRDRATIKRTRRHHDRRRLADRERRGVASRRRERGAIQHYRARGSGEVRRQRDGALLLVRTIGGELQAARVVRGCSSPDFCGTLPDAGERAADLGPPGLWDPAQEVLVATCAVARVAFWGRERPDEHCDCARHGRVS